MLTVDPTHADWNKPLDETPVEVHHTSDAKERARLLGMSGVLRYAPGGKHYVSQLHNAPPDFKMELHANAQSHDVYSSRIITGNTTATATATAASGTGVELHAVAMPAPSAPPAMSRE